MEDSAGGGTASLAFELVSASRNSALVAVGLALVLAGFIVPGKEVEFAIASVTLGVLLIVVSALSSRFSEFELGAAGLKAKLRDENQPAVPLSVEGGTLTQFAHLVLGDPESARSVVEEALAKRRTYRWRVPAGERDTLLLRQLVDLLEADSDRSWLQSAYSDPAQARGELSDPAIPAVIRALRTIPSRDRIVYVLKMLLVLRDEDIAAVMALPESEINDIVARVRVGLRPYLDEWKLEHD